MELFAIPDSSPMISYDTAWSPTYTAGSDGYDRSVHIASAAQRAGFSLNITATALTLNIDHPPSTPCTAYIRINGSTPSPACPSPSSPFRLSGLPPGLHCIEYSTQPFDQASTTTTSNTTSAIHFWGMTGERLKLDARQWRNETYDDGYLVSSGRGDGFAYSLDGGWVMEKGDGPVGSGVGGGGGKGDVTLSVTERKGAEVSFTGSGTAMYLYGRVGPEYGSVSVTLNNATSSSGLNLTSPWPNPSQLLYLVSGLDPAIPHTIKLVNLEGKRFSVDRMVVTQNGAGTSAEHSTFLSTTHGKIIFFVVIPLLVLCLLTFGICVFFPNIRRNSSLMRIRRDRERARRQAEIQARAGGRSAAGALEKVSAVSTFDSVESGGSGPGKKARVQAPSERQQEGDGSGWWARRMGFGKKAGKGALDRKGSQAALRPYWMDEDVYSFKEASHLGTSTERSSTPRVGGISPSGLGTHVDLLDSARTPTGGKLRDRPSSSTLSRLLLSSPKVAKPFDSDAMSAKTGRTDRTRDLVIPYEAGRQSSMVASPRSKGISQVEDSGAFVGEAEERKGYRQPKPAKSTDTFGIDVLGPKGKGKGRPGRLGAGGMSREASFATPPTSSLPSPTFLPVLEHHDGAKIARANREDAGSRASSASWATLIRPINALLAKRASSSTAFSSIPSPGLPTMASTAPHADTATSRAPALTHLQIPMSAADGRNSRGPSPMSGSATSSYPLTPTTTRQYTAHIEGYTRGVKQGARYMSKGPEDAAGDIGEAGRGWAKREAVGQAVSTRGTEASEYGEYGGDGYTRESSGYRFTSSLPSDLSPSSPVHSALPTASSASRYSGILRLASVSHHRRSDISAQTKPSTRTDQTRIGKHAKKYSRDFPPAHPFAAANQRNRYSASPSERGSSVRGSEASGRWNHGSERGQEEGGEGDAHREAREAHAGVQGDDDALSTRGAPPSVRLSIKSSFTARSDLGALSPQLFPLHLRRDSITAQVQAQEAGGTGYGAANIHSPSGSRLMGGQEGAPSSWRAGHGVRDDSYKVRAAKAKGRRISLGVGPLRVGREQVGEGSEEDEGGDRLPIILYT